MQGQVDQLAVGLLNAVARVVEERTQMNGLAEFANTHLSGMVSEACKGIEVDPIVMGLGKLIWSNINANNAARNIGK